ncbi:hypothetical protein [Pedobacter gandavensis]|uniref:Uncharacterized protein n=1 Tax=Pedobacter gandavensis TaxID=2679963 RepID=A0ABR6EYL9_9SPHI|nr:hypothetical protein [Pedobacter gandavensis]MBB2150383.1 hypothetical protein [Pedobacter gandavensis]
MTITVLPIIEPDIKPADPLVKVMNDQLVILARELQDLHLKEVELMEPLFDDIVIYISYNNKQGIRWKIVNDVPESAINEVATQCDKLGYVRWKTATLNAFNRG